MRRTYKNPPLIEALCEFHFAPETPQKFDSIIQLLSQRIQAHFPKRLQLQLQASQIDVGASGMAEITKQILPLVRFQSTHGQVLIQVGQNLLTVNHLRPYTSWENFLPSIEVGLHAYREVVKPATILRIALRYINRIEIPGNRIQLEEYLELRPFIGQTVLQDLAAFTLGIQIPHEDGRDMLSIQLASTDSGSLDTVAILLDLTYYLTRTEDFSLDTVSEWLTTAHNTIEEAFEACLTDHLRNLFEEVKEC